MLPYILAAVGGYLIGSSSDKKVIPNKAIFADGGDIYDLGDLTDVDEYDTRSQLEAVLKAIDENKFEYESEYSQKIFVHKYEYSAEAKVMTRFDLPAEVKFEIEIKNIYEEGMEVERKVEISDDDFDYEGLYKRGEISQKNYEKIENFLDKLYKEAMANMDEREMY